MNPYSVLNIHEREKRKCTLWCMKGGGFLHWRLLSVSWSNSFGFPLSLQSKINDIHVVCGTLKDFFRNLAEPLITYGLWKKFVDAASKPSDRQPLELAAVPHVLALVLFSRQTRWRWQYQCHVPGGQWAAPAQQGYPGTAQRAPPKVCFWLNHTYFDECRWTWTPRPLIAGMAPFSC